MKCEKCGYSEKKMRLFFEKPLCRVCSAFAPKSKADFKEYLSEKIDWKKIETFRKYASEKGKKIKEEMERKAGSGAPMTRAPLGYGISNGRLTKDENSAKIHRIYKTFLENNYSLNQIAKTFSLSVNGLKKILTNRAYLGEIKFNGRIYSGDHEKIISEELFYAVQRKLKTILNSKGLSK